MTNYQQLPDHIPFRHSAQEFFYTLKNLSESDSNTYFYADRQGLKTVGTVEMIFQKIIGFFGGKDHTSLANVETTLAKLLTYGHLEGYTTHESFKPWVRALRSRTTDFQFSANMTQIMSLIESGRGSKQELQGLLLGLHAEHGDKVNALGGKTAIPGNYHPDFGRTPFILAERSLSKGHFDKAVCYAENAYRLRESFDEVASLFLRIGERIPHRNDGLVLRLKEFKNHALESGSDDQALKFDRVLKRLDPTAPSEKDTHILVRLGRAASLSNPQEALSYFEQASSKGASVEGEKRSLYLSQSQKAIEERRPVDALKYYELAMENGHPEDSRKLGELYLNAAQDLCQAESSKTGWRVQRNFAPAINYFEKAIAIFKKEQVILEKVFDGNWLSSYLEALKGDGQVQRGITMVTGLADILNEHSKEPKSYYLEKGERIAHIQKVKGFIMKAIKLYEIAMHFDPTNGEHPFKIANLYDYLNIESDTRDAYPLFLKAAECDPENKYYKVGVRLAASSQHREVPDWCVGGCVSGLDIQLIEGWFRNGERFQKGSVRVTGRLEPHMD